MDITGKPIYENCETQIKFVDDMFKEHVYCSRICAIAADLLFSFGAEKMINENLQTGDYNDDAHNEAFDQIVEDVMEECGCTEEEMIDAFTRIEVVVGQFSGTVDKELLKYQ